MPDSDNIKKRVLEKSQKLVGQSKQQESDEYQKGYAKEMGKNQAKIDSEKSKLIERERIKTEALRERERIKTEAKQERKKSPKPEYDMPRDQPVLLERCPLGHHPGYCIEYPCDRRPQCNKEKVINPEYDFALTPFLRHPECEYST